VGIDGVSGDAHSYFGINFNGNETASGNVNTSMFWVNNENGIASQFSAGDLISLNNQYSTVRCAGVKLKWYPGLPNGISGPTVYAPQALIYDRDGIEVDTTVPPVYNFPTVATAMEQTNGVRIKNMYRPWKMWLRTPKYRMNTRIVSYNQGPSGEANYSPNENIAGQWKGPTEALTQSLVATNTTPQSYILKNRGAHFLLVSPLPGGYPEDTQVPMGTLVVTSYFVYRDRR